MEGDSEKVRRDSEREASGSLLHGQHGSELDLIRKGQKFVPAPKRVDTVAKFNHSNDHARKLCLKVFLIRNW